MLGVAGTGKSWLVDLATPNLKQYAFYRAYTGTAACIIGGSTIHSLVNIRSQRNKKPSLSGKALDELRNKQLHIDNPAKGYLVTDEKSMDKI